MGTFSGFVSGSKAAVSSSASSFRFDANCHIPHLKLAQMPWSSPRSTPSAGISASFNNLRTSFANSLLPTFGYFSL